MIPSLPLIFTISIIISLITIKITLILMQKYQILDKPHLYGQNRPPVPYPIGIIIWPLFSLLVIYFFPLDKTMIGILISSFIIALISIIDDFYKLSPKIRLLWQLIAIGILIAFGLGVDTFTNPLTGLTFDASLFYKTTFYPLGQQISLSPLADTLTFIWIILFINVMNWLDGIEGNSTGLTLIGALILAAVSLLPNVHQENTATLALILAGICSGLLFFNFPFPRVKCLLGDSGSMLLGFLLATLAIFYGAKIATTILLFALPILDALIVIIRRIAKHKNPMQGDYTHLHHRLLQAGWSRARICLLFYSISITLGLLALLSSSLLKTLILSLVIFLFLIYLHTLEKSLPHKINGPF